MPKPNYGHVKRQKEAARKARQQEKQNRKQSRTPGTDAPADPVTDDTAAAVPGVGSTP